MNNTYTNSTKQNKTKNNKYSQKTEKVNMTYNRHLLKSQMQKYSLIELVNKIFQKFQYFLEFLGIDSNLNS